MKKVGVVGLLIATVLIAGCYGTQTTTLTVPTTATANSVEIKGFAFNPGTITIKKGTTVTWTHNDGVPHTVTTTKAPVDFDSGRMSKGNIFSQTFNTVGTYEYYCSIHPSMRGKVIVTE
jgi:plastocyanin